MCRLATSRPAASRLRARHPHPSLAGGRGLTNGPLLLPSGSNHLADAALPGPLQTDDVREPARTLGLPAGSSGAAARGAMVALLQTVQTLVTLAALWLGTVFVLRRVLPALTNLLSRHVSIRTVSLRSIRGLEWRHTRRRAGREQAVSVRVERCVLPLGSALREPLAGLASSTTSKRRPR